MWLVLAEQAVQKAIDAAEAEVKDTAESAPATEGGPAAPMPPLDTQEEDELFDEELDFDGDDEVDQTVAASEIVSEEGSSPRIPIFRVSLVFGGAIRFAERDCCRPNGRLRIPGRVWFSHSRPRVVPASGRRRNFVPDMSP